MKVLEFFIFVPFISCILAQETATTVATSTISDETTSFDVESIAPSSQNVLDLNTNETIFSTTEAIITNETISAITVETETVAVAAEDSWISVSSNIAETTTIASTVPTLTDVTATTNEIISVTDVNLQFNSTFASIASNSRNPVEYDVTPVETTKASTTPTPRKIHSTTTKPHKKPLHGKKHNHSFESDELNPFDEGDTKRRKNEEKQQKPFKNGRGSTVEIFDTPFGPISITFEQPKHQNIRNNEDQANREWFDFGAGGRYNDRQVRQNNDNSIAEFLNLLNGNNRYYSDQAYSPFQQAYYGENNRQRNADQEFFETLFGQQFYNNFGRQL